MMNLKTTRMLGWVGAAVLAMAPAAPLGAQAQGKIIERIIVKVNGDIFTQTELERQLKDTIQQRNKQVLNTLDLQSNAAFRAMVEELTPDLLVKAVDEMLMVQRGRELGYALSDENFKAAVERIKNDPQNNIRSDEQFQAALAQQNMTMADLRAQMERQMLSNQAERDDVWGKMNLTEAEQRQYYDAHQTEFQKAPSVTLREILIAVPVVTQGGTQGVNVGADNAAKAKIDGIRERALKGEDFNKLVAEASEAPSKANGGLIGPIQLSDLNTELRTMIDGMKQGDVSAPIRTPRGYQILKLETKTTQSVEPFETVRDQIANKFMEQRRDAEMKKYLDRLRSQAIIDWKDDGLKKMYEAKLAKDKAGD